MKYKALSIKQPWAEKIAHKEKTVELRSMNTHYRGDILICASASGASNVDLPRGCTVCIAELYDSILYSKLTEKHFKDSCVPLADISRYMKGGGYGWMLRNVRRVIELPMKGQLGIFTLDLGEQLLTEYPTALNKAELNHLLGRKIPEMSKKKAGYSMFLFCVIILAIFAVWIPIILFCRHLYHLFF
ncbi:MAG: ASCH domain-containing protein [Bacteroidales bacterium]